MRKPLSVSGIASLIFLVLGSMFMLFGYLAYEEFMNAYSDFSFRPEFVFIISGIGIFIMGIMLIYLEIRSRIIYKTIIEHGDYTRVTVTKIKHETGVRFNHKSPYVVYVKHGDIYDLKDMRSFYIWENPDFVIGDRIKVLVHNKYPNNFVIEEDK